MFVATCELDLLLGDVHSLKEKRAIVRPIVKEVRRRFDVAVAETDYQDLHRRAQVPGAGVSGDATHARGVVDACEEWGSGLPETMLVGARRRLFGGEDEGLR
ncbi:MAG: DUF503 domain-containing protein [Candidatus Nanopelagicales bacterium]